MHRRHRLDVVHGRVRFRLVVESTVSPVLADVIDLALCSEVVVFDHRARGCHQPQGLREGLCGRCQGTILLGIAKRKIALRLAICHVVERADRKLDVGQLPGFDVGADLCSN